MAAVAGQDIPRARPPLEERLLALSGATRAVAEASADSLGLLEALARGLAEVAQGSCAVLLLSDDGRALRLAAAGDPDPAAQRALRAALQQPVLLDADPLARRVLESGEPHLAPRLETGPLSPPADGQRDLAARLSAHSLSMVALREGGRSLGLLAFSRAQRQRPPFDAHDLALQQSLAGSVALALSHARLLAETRREPAERERLTRRLRARAEAAQEFSSNTDDHAHLLAVIARRLGELVGDLCAIRAVTEDGQWLESTGAVYHRDPALLALTREVMASDRQRVGEGLSGRVAATGKALLSPLVGTAEFVASSLPRYRALLEQLGVTSSMTLPLLCRGKVVGIANLMRSDPAHPYDDEDLLLVESVAAHAALSIGNARAYAAERTARDAAESATRALRLAEARFARLYESGIIGIMVSDLDGHVSAINDALLGLVGYTREEILSGSVAWRDLTPPEWREVDARAVEQLLASGIGGLREKEYVHKDGRLVPVLAATAMLEGAREGVSFVLDLTERKEAQAAVAKIREERAADAKFRGLLESAPDAMVIAGSDGRIVLVNAQAERLFGYPRTELVGEPIELLIPERFKDAHPSRLAGYLREPRIRAMSASQEIRARRKDGSEFPVDVSLGPVETEDGLLVSSWVRDVTARKEAERQTESLAAIVDSSADAIIGKTLGGVVTSWNQGAQRIFGYAPGEMVGRSISLLIPPGREEEEPAILDSIAHDKVRRFETMRRRKDGRDIDVSVTVSPVRDAAGHVVGVSKVARDVTAQKRAEAALAQARDAAEASNRELEAFSYSVAHDLRAPLRGMNGFAQVLLDAYGEKFDAEGRDWLEEILLNAKKMGALIDALLSLSRLSRSPLRREPVDLSALVRAAFARLAAEGPGRQVELIVEDGLRASLDPLLAQALIENLVGNAWKFTGKTGAPRIEFAATVKDSVTAFCVKDNGAGFDMAFAGKMFAPFQRLHTTAEFAGTGIGLATVQRIVHRHGGRVWAEGEVGGGARFYFSLPDSGAAP